MSSPSTSPTPENYFPCTAFDTEVARRMVEDLPLTTPTNEEERKEIQHIEELTNRVAMNEPETQQAIMRNLDEVLASHEVTEQTPPLLDTAPGQNLLREVLMRDFRNRMTTSPPSTTDLHPGYPFREQTDQDDDLPDRRYPRPYLAAKVDPITGEPRIHGRADKESPTYDEGPLHATEVQEVEDNMEGEVGEYPFGEDAYLDPNFLQAMGTLGDRGLASEGLRLVQLDGEKCNRLWYSSVAESLRLRIYLIDGPAGSAVV